MGLPTDPVLEQLRSLDKSSPSFGSQLDHALRRPEYSQCTRGLNASELMWLVNYLDGVLDGGDLARPASRKCLHELKRICGTNGVLPASYTTPVSLLTVGPMPYSCGGFGDVYKETIGGTTVCVKRLRMLAKDCAKGLAKEFCKEAVMWRYLKHPNILPLLGVTTSPPQLISRWMPGGDLSDYITEHPTTDRLGLLSDVAKGLNYLHSHNVIHGDLKGLNVLVDSVEDSPVALIADFGVAMVVRNVDSMQIQRDTRQDMFSPQWSALEVLNGENPTKESDVYSLAMVAIEVFTNKAPFPGKTPYVAVRDILNGERPPRPAHTACTDALWDSIQRCWNSIPQQRPRAGDLLQAFSPSGPPNQGYQN